MHFLRTFLGSLALNTWPVLSVHRQLSINTCENQVDDFLVEPVAKGMTCWFGQQRCDWAWSQDFLVSDSAASVYTDKAKQWGSRVTLPPLLPYP